MFPFHNLSTFSVIAFLTLLIHAGIVRGSNITASTSNRKIRQIRQYDNNPSLLPPPQQSVQFNGYPPGSGSDLSLGGGGNGQPSIFYQSPGGSAAAVSSGGYIPGPPPPSSQPPSSSLQQSYLSGPLYSPSYDSGYIPGPPPGLSPSYISSSDYYSPQQQQQSQDPPPIYPGSSLGYQPNLSPYGGTYQQQQQQQMQQQQQQYSPVIYPYGPSSSSTGYLPGKPPSPQYGPPQYSPYYGPSSASASASAGGGGAASAAASISSPNQGFGWFPPPTPPPTQSQQIVDNGPFGWGPPPPQNPPPQRPPPEFSYQFSLKPSSFGWETSYNVPCGNYQIQPRVIAHLRLATQAVLPKETPDSLKESQSGDNRREGRQSIPPLRSFIDPFRLERQLQSYNPYDSQQFPQQRPTFRPRTCRWNFDAVDGCRLNFKCTWFQLPALFRCNENFLHVTDNTIGLDDTFCGNRKPRQIYSSNSGKLTLTFKSEGSALPAILDCTVLCTPLEDGFNSDLLNTPIPTDAATDIPISSIVPTVDQPTQFPFPSYPIIAQQVTFTSPNQGTRDRDQRKNVTLIIKRQSTPPSQPAKPQLRMGNCKCGVPDSHYASKVVHGRIVGGSSMMPGESPWTAALVKKNSNRPYCGATLINSKFLLTAAHCVLNCSATTQQKLHGRHNVMSAKLQNENIHGITCQARKTRDSNVTSDSRNKTEQQRIYFDVLLNEHDISQPNEIAGGTIRAKVDKVIVHPDYDNVTFNYDAALIRLAESVEFNSWTERRVSLSQTYHLSSNNTSTSPVGSERRRESVKDNTHRLFHNTFDFHSLKRKKRFLIPEIEARATPPKPVPICLPDSSDSLSDRLEEKNGRTKKDIQDDYAMVTGWGLVTEGGTPSTEMLKARVQIFNDSTCQDLYKKHNYVITGSMMCAGYINGKIDSCVGDSGSPLATEDKDRFVLTGVVSWGRGCGRKMLPGIYTKVTELMDWIYSEASDDDVIWCE